MRQRKNERGVVIMLVAVFMLFVVGAMAALSIDVATIYTARSEAQLAADGAALAGARALVTSGMTSDTTGGLTPGAEIIAAAIATQVAQQNSVGGRLLKATEVVVSFGGNPPTNPTVIVKVQRTDLPTFFARIWGSTQVTVGASATAEAYNPSGANALVGTTTPVAPVCVKPWLLPNLDPSPAGTTIFNAATGAITNTGLLGWTSGTPMSFACGPGGICTPPFPGPTAWNYYPGEDNPLYFPHPTHALPTCVPVLTSSYQESIAGCIEKPIACNSQVNIDTSPYGPTRNSDTADAVNCLTHATAGNGDKVAVPAPPAAPFQFVAGADTPIPGASTKDVMVSSSLVTVPVFDSTTLINPVQIVGFVQLFLNPDGTAAPAVGGVNTTVINMAGCGTGASGTPILGNGASPVAVRLISPP